LRFVVFVVPLKNTPEASPRPCCRRRSGHGVGGRWWLGLQVSDVQLASRGGRVGVRTLVDVSIVPVVKLCALSACPGGASS